jgi:hypothetical protein
MTKYLNFMIASLLITLNLQTIQSILWDCYEVLVRAMGGTTPSEGGYKFLSIIAVILFLYVFIKELKR